MPLVPYTAFPVAQAVLGHGARDEALFLGRLWPCDLTLKELREVLERHGFDPPAATRDLAPSTRIDDRDLCRLLGLSGCQAMDLDPGEGAQFVHDLNRLPPPAECRGRFGVIFNFGTMEHVFHVPNFLENVFEMLKVGGVVVHSAPANNMVEHGFYQASPTLFFDYYSANRFQILDCFLVRHDLRALGRGYTLEPFSTYDHPPDPLYAKLGSDVVDVLFFARKTADSTGNAIPTQFRYRRSPR